MGIRLRFIIIMLVLGSLSIIGTGVASYQFSERSAINEAKLKGDIIFNSMLSMQKNFMATQRPLLLELVEKDRFYPELMSGAVITRMTWDIFEKENPDYKFKQAALDPRWPPNKADETEIAIINKFQSNHALKNQSDVIDRDGQPYYYRATPRLAKKGCLRCHGDPLTAPKDQIEIYGDKAGYQWKEGDVTAAFVVYIPLGKALAEAKSNSALLLAIGSGGLLITLLGIWFFLDRGVVSPLVNLSNRTEEISLGRGLDQKIEVTSKDEIGVLTQSIERLRISLVKILKRSAK